jgi:Acetyltransferase (GNAT) domain
MMSMCDTREAYAVERYSPERKAMWDAFLATAKNSTFLFRRDYMDYHSDRFKDHSLMVFCENRLTALLPANLAADGEVISHQGLTYGGLVVAHDSRLCEVLGSFHALLKHLHEAGIPQLLYKRCPRFYNTLPDDEVDYALFNLKAQLSRRDCALVVNQADRLPLSTRRKREIKKAARAEVKFAQDSSFAPFWEQVLVPRLVARFGVKPVHTLDEITLLASRFPENIKQYSAYCGDEIVAGATIYETAQVAHAQYIAISDRGQEIGALDALFAWLIDECYKQKVFFSFGICNENQGRSLNHGLLDWKEGFGGRTFAHDFYEIDTGSYVKLEPVLARESAAPQNAIAPASSAVQN